jgi:hypothetical protein
MGISEWWVPVTNRLSPCSLSDIVSSFVDTPCDPHCRANADNCPSDVIYGVNHAGNLLVTYDIYVDFVGISIQFSDMLK